MRGIFGLVSNMASSQVMAGVPASQPSTPPITSPPHPAAPASVQQYGGSHTPIAIGVEHQRYASSQNLQATALTSPCVSSGPTSRPTVAARRAYPVTSPNSAGLRPPAASSSTPPREYRLTLTIDGRQLTCDARHVPDPPVRHFSKNVDLLFQHWAASTILSIDGSGVPLKYWPDVYKGLGRLGLKPKAWDAIKVEWGNWKVCLQSRRKHGQ